MLKILVTGSDGRFGKILKKFDLIGQNILQKTFNEINLSLKK